MKKILMVVVLVVVCSFASLAYGELIDRGNGMIYDTDFNITWYANPKMANLVWCEAMAWAAGLNINGITGWRLPSALNLDGTGPCLPQPPDTAAFCKMSEFGHLYSTELGNIFGEGGADSYGPFVNGRWFYYWTNTTHATDSTKAYMFSPGGETFIAKKAVDTGFGWAVHDGDVANLAGAVLPPLPVAVGCPGQPQVVVPPPVVSPVPAVEPVVCPPPVVLVEPAVCPTPEVCPTPVVCPTLAPIPTPAPIPVVKPTLVGIDIKQHLINPQSRGKIQVAILSSKTFNAPTMVDIGSLTFGRMGTEDSLAFCHRYSKDLNRDKYPDLICEFNTTVMDFQCGDTVGFLMGNTLSGDPFEGKDSVIINCEKPHKK